MSIQLTHLTLRTGGASSLTIALQFGISEAQIQYAADLLRAGKLVAFPIDET